MMVIPWTIRLIDSFSGEFKTLVILFTATQVYKDSSPLTVSVKFKMETRVWMKSIWVRVIRLDCSVTNEPSDTLIQEITGNGIAKTVQVNVAVNVTLTVSSVDGDSVTFGGSKNHKIHHRH